MRPLLRADEKDDCFHRPCSPHPPSKMVSLLRWRRLIVVLIFTQPRRGGHWPSAINPMLLSINNRFINSLCLHLNPVNFRPALLWRDGRSFESTRATVVLVRKVELEISKPSISSEMLENLHKLITNPSDCFVHLFKGGARRVGDLNSN